ncbi:MAG TPA: 50S ribosomal protein L31 [Bellilinea sp.]|nr:50S ribosomal protein L31 [Bellilinea sp.]
MRKNIQPTYYPDAVVVCACGNTWKTGSTKKEIRTEVCSKCHPFFTGQQQRILDIEGQVDRFYKRLQARQDFVESVKTRQTSKVSLDRPVAELELTSRSADALTKAGVNTVGDIMTKLAEGDNGLLDLEGFGQKSLIDLKKKLRTLGYNIPSAE